MDRFEELKERVKEANDLVSVIESYLPLRRSGRNMTALCPFHPEKTPSFTVYPESQHFKCYGCGKAGDVFTFVQEREGLTFRQCFEMLAERAGISVADVLGKRRSRDARAPDAHAALAQVRDHLHQVLASAEGTGAREYLAARGLTQGIEPFRLGYHPASRGALRRFAQSKGLPLEVLQQAGLLGQEGREPFWGRVIFPIEDERGRVVGFGGRTLDGHQPKYINSPESPFFQKRRVLYGLRHAKEAGNRKIVVMEGYTDVIACHLTGFTGAVATLGTALTRDHGRVLLRYAHDGVVLLFDGDRAGRAAAEKAYPELARAELVTRVALLPEGTDPADLVAQKGSQAEIDARREAFARTVDTAEDALAMWFQLKRGRLDLTTETHVGVVIDDCAMVLSGMEDPAQRQILQSRMARQLGIDEGVFRRSLARREKRPAAPSDARAPQPQRATPSPMAKAEVDLLACVLAAPALLERAVSGWADPGRMGVLLEAARVAAEAGIHDRDGMLRHLFTCAADAPELAEMVAGAADVAQRIHDAPSTLETLLGHRRVYLARAAAQQIRFELREASSAGDHARVDELTRRYVTQLRDQQFG